MSITCTHCDGCLPAGVPLGGDCQKAADCAVTGASCSKYTSVSSDTTCCMGTGATCSRGIDCCGSNVYCVSAVCAQSPSGVIPAVTSALTPVPTAEATPVPSPSSGACAAPSFANFDVASNHCSTNEQATCNRSALCTLAYRNAFLSSLRVHQLMLFISHEPNIPSDFNQISNFKDHHGLE